MVLDLNTFLGYPPSFNRTTGVWGPVVTDPSCLYDPTTKAFFLVVLTLETTAAGNYTGVNHLDIAVAKDPTGTWNIYRWTRPTTAATARRSTRTAPASATTRISASTPVASTSPPNEYSFFGPEFNSAQIYAFSKRALARGDADVLVTQFDTTRADRGRNGFTVWPAQSPAADQYSTAVGGTEYFLSSNAAAEATGTDDYVSHSIVTWSLTNTSSLDSAHPNPQLQDTRVAVRTYSLPPASNQKPGPVPLAECLNSDPCSTVLIGAPDPFKPEAESPLDSNDTRMQRVTYANGALYGALDTAVTVGGAQKAGVAWYIVRPQATPKSLQATLAAQGKLGLAGNNLTYPAIGVNAAGKGVMAFTLVGADYYPSAAYAAFDGRTGAGEIFLAKAGLGPQDGFAAYKVFNAPDPARPRTRSEARICPPSQLAPTPCPEYPRP